MRVLITGLGNIGTTLAALLLHYRDLLGIDEVVALQRTIATWRSTDHAPLVGRGLRVLPYADAFVTQARLADYVFETTSNGVGLRNKVFYAERNNLKGVSAQGSETGFGVPYMSGINNAVIHREKLVQIVSCNTHGAMAILHGISGGAIGSIKHADMVVVRRSEDLGQHQRLVSANVVSRHLDATAGTHHGMDVTRLLQTIGVQIPVVTSDITTPSQLLHSIRFAIEMESPVTEQQVQHNIASSKLLAATHKYDSNVIFEQGRRYGFAGRMYSPAIVVSNNILVQNSTVRGWAFVPQEGNTMLSTLNAFLLQVGGDVGAMDIIVKEQTRSHW